MSDVAADPPIASGAAEYPVELDLNAPLEIDRWRPLVQWFLAIPHYFVLWALMLVSAVITFIAFFSILFTKKYPRSMFDFVVSAYRYQWRVNSYAYFMRQVYPPFDLNPSASDPGNDPASYSVDYPTELNRWLPLVKWLLAIPHLFVILIRGLMAFFVGFAAFFAVLFTGAYPATMREFLIDVTRYLYRVQAYMLLQRDEYPPFSTK
jgi:hypothetical protein